MANKEVIYVLGNGYPEDTPWKFTHPRHTRTGTNLVVFDYRATVLKQKEWNAWDGKLPPGRSPDKESDIKTVIDLYNYIKSISKGMLSELHFFTHGWEAGPVLLNTFEDPPYNTSVDERDPNDADPRLKDFVIDDVLGDVEGTKFKNAFSPTALVKLWGCNHREDFRQMIKRGYYKAKTAAARNTIKQTYQDFIRDGTYPFKLQHLIGIPVYASPLGWGTNPYLPFGIEGASGSTTKARYRGVYPPARGDQWWRVSSFFRPDKGREFYTKVLGATLDILDYVAYTDAIAPPSPSAAPPSP